MSWLPPTPLLMLAGVAALLLVPSLVRRPVSRARFIAEAFITTLAIIALVWLGWIALWLIELRW